MDEKDEKIISLLKKNSRSGYSTLSKELGITDVAVKKRIKRLQEKGVIKKFTIEVDDKEMGKKIQAILLIRAEAGRIKDLISKLSRVSGIMEANPSIGEHDLIARVSCNTIDELKNIVENKVNLLDGVIDVKTNILV